MKKLVGIIASVLVIAAGAGYYWTHRPVEQAHAAELHVVADKFFDPESVRWRGLAIAPDGAVCGEVNAKNKMGGYSGFKKFYVYQGSYGIDAMDEAQALWVPQNAEQAAAMGAEGLQKRINELKAAKEAAEGLVAHCPMLFR